MNFIKLDGDNGPIVLAPTVLKDNRGYFFESYNEAGLKDVIGNVDFVQDNESRSSYGTVRGLHFQKGQYAQAKLVRVAKGAVVDVVVDIRPDSPSFGRHYFAYLSEENHRSFFVPRGFAHGFIALRDDTVFQYKCDNYYNKESEGSIFFADAELDIPWVIWMEPSELKLSDKDLSAPTFAEFRKSLEEPKEAPEEQEQPKETEEPKKDEKIQ